MRYKSTKIELNEHYVKEFFAIFPITINKETRWLEVVKVERYWTYGTHTGRYMVNVKFKN